MKLFNFASLVLAVVLLSAYDNAWGMYKQVAGPKEIASWGIDGELYAALVDTKSELDLVKLANVIERGAQPNRMYITDGLVGDAHMAPLHLAAVYNPQAVPLLIEKGASVNVIDEDRLTPLHFAALGLSQAYVVAAIALINAGANVNAANKYLLTPLAYAHFGQPDQKKRNKTMIKVLSDAGGHK